MIMVGRSLVCGRRGGAPSPIPRPRAGGLPEREHDGPVPARAFRGRRALAARAARAGPQQQGVVRAPDPADERAARADGSAARRDHSRCGAHGVDHRRHQRRAPRGRHQATRATRSSRATRSTLACSDRSPPRATRAARPSASCCSRTCPTEVREDTRMVVTSHVSWATGRVMDTGRSPPPTHSSCSTGRRASARYRWTCARSAATSTPRRARNGCAARAAWATCTRTRSSCPDYPPPGAAITPWSGPSRRSCPHCSPTRAGSPPASRSPTTWSGPTPCSTCSRRPASTRFTPPPSTEPSGSPGCSATAASPWRTVAPPPSSPSSRRTRRASLSRPPNRGS